MTASRTFLGLLFSLVASVSNAWVTLTPPCTPRCTRTSLEAHGTSRRNFVATSIIGAAVAGSSTLVAPEPVQAKSLPTGTELVNPNDLKGKVVVITGASTGIGLESGKALAKGGATVVLTARNQAKGTKAVNTVQEYLKNEGVENSNIYTVSLDLDDLDSVKGFPTRFQETLGATTKIDVLMNNAGVMAVPDRQLTKDGYERTFQSNHLGHFVLTSQLAPLLQKDARVINVSSLAYQFVQGLDLANLNGEKDYGPWSSYGQSKLENILFTQELQRRADEAGLQWTVTSLHPGAVNTDLARNMMGGDEAWFAKKEQGPSTLLEKFLDKTINKALLTPEQGAATQVYLAVAPQEEKARFYSDLKPQKLPAYATDERMAKSLWELSEEMAGLKFSLKN